MHWSTALLLGLASAMALAQTPEAPATPQPQPLPTGESKFHAELRREGERASEACSLGFKAIPNCGYQLFTDHPLHIAAGSMPPQNGFGLGGAFVWAKDTKNWRMTWDLDSVGSTNLSWRAGGYMKMIHTPPVVIRPIIPTTSESGPAKKKKREPNFVHPDTVVNLYAQSISLNKLNYFGLGNNTTLATASVFGMDQTIVGANVIKPVFEWPAIRGLNLALLAEINGRFVDIRGAYGQSVPSILNVFTTSPPPGLNTQPGFLQFGEGFRIQPEIMGRLQLNYTGTFQQFVAPSDSQYSFRRWTADLNHTFLLYGHSKSAPIHTDTLGPNQCAPPGENCPRVSYSRNLYGSIGVRLFASESIATGTSAVPFYFQQTLGGSDINSALSLGSYQDYRFRAPNLLLLQENIEHSIWGPFGAQFMTDQGRVALTRSDLGFSHLKHSFAGGLTLRAGAFPMVSLMFAWGGPEGHHNIVNMNTSLLGGSARPPLD